MFQNGILSHLFIAACGKPVFPVQERLYQQNKRIKGRTGPDCRPGICSAFQVLSEILEKENAAS
jgi:hypothetical protein